MLQIYFYITKCKNKLTQHIVIQRRNKLNALKFQFQPASIYVFMHLFSRFIGSGLLDLGLVSISVLVSAVLTTTLACEYMIKQAKK